MPMTESEYCIGTRDELEALRHRVSRLRMTIAAVAVIAVLGVIIGTLGNAKACQSRHALVTVGAKLIGGDAQRAALRGYLEAGTITQAQYDQALENMRKNLEVYKSADCRFP